MPRSRYRITVNMIAQGPVDIDKLMRDAIIRVVEQEWPGVKITIEEIKLPDGLPHKKPDKRKIPKEHKRSKNGKFSH